MIPSYNPCDGGNTTVSSKACIVVSREQPPGPGQRLDDLLGPAVHRPEGLDMRLVVLEGDDGARLADAQPLHNRVGGFHSRDEGFLCKESAAAASGRGGSPD